MAKLADLKDKDGHYVHYDAQGKALIYQDRCQIAYCGECADTHTVTKGVRIQATYGEFVECQGCFEVRYA